MTKHTIRISRTYVLIFVGILFIIAGVIFGYILSTHGLAVLGTQNINSSLPRQIAEEMMGTCRIEGERCYSNEFAKLASVEDLETSIAVLDEINQIDPQTRGCHLIAHSISTEETLKDTNKWKEILTTVPADRCTGGFLHGIFEARQSKDPTIQINEKTIPEFCKIVEDRSNGGNDQDCAHIFGHLLVVVNDADLTKASDVCSKLPEQLQYECQSGVFMENETRDGIVQHGLGEYISWNTQTTSAQKEICDLQTGIASKACWREISHMFAYLSQDYPPEMFRLCSEAENVDDVTDCYMHGIGVTVVSSNFDSNNFSVLCAPFSQPQMYAQCVSMAIGSMMTSSLAFSNDVKLLCEKIPDNFKKGCYETFGKQIMRLAGVSELKKYCEDVTFPYKEYCEKPYL